MKNYDLDNCKSVLLSYLKIPPVWEDFGGFVNVNHPLIGMLSRFRWQSGKDITEKELLTDRGWEKFKSYVKEELYDEMDSFDYYDLALCLQDSYIVDYLFKAEKYMPDGDVVKVVEHLMKRDEKYLEPYDKLSKLLKRIRNTEPENEFERARHIEMYRDLDELIPGTADYVYRAIPVRRSQEKKILGSLWNCSWIDELFSCHAYGDIKVYKVIRGAMELRELRYITYGTESGELVMKRSLNIEYCDEQPMVDTGASPGWN